MNTRVEREINQTVLPLNISTSLTRQKQSIDRMSAAESLLTHYQQHRSITPKTRVKADVATSTVTTVAPVLQRAPDTSLASVTQDHYLRILTREERNPTTPSANLTNRNLLVSRRLALKRQRAAIHGPSLHYAPIRSAAFQLELGNADDIQTGDDRHTIASPSVANQRIRPISTHTTPLRGETPHSAPTDISLMYRSVPRQVARRPFRILRSFDPLERDRLILIRSRVGSLSNIRKILAIHLRVRTFFPGNRVEREMLLPTHSAPDVSWRRVSSTRLNQTDQSRSSRRWFPDSLAETMVCSFESFYHESRFQSRE